MGIEILYRGKKLCAHQTRKYPQKVGVGQGLKGISRENVNRQCAAIIYILGVRP